MNKKRFINYHYYVKWLIYLLFKIRWSGCCSGYFIAHNIQIKHIEYPFKISQNFVLLTTLILRRSRQWMLLMMLMLMKCNVCIRPEICLLLVVSQSRSLSGSGPAIDRQPMSVSALRRKILFVLSLSMKATAFPTLHQSEASIHVSWTLLTNQKPVFSQGRPPPPLPL